MEKPNIDDKIKFLKTVAGILEEKNAKMVDLEMEDVAIDANMAFMFREIEEDLALMKFNLYRNHADFPLPKADNLNSQLSLVRRWQVACEDWIKKTSGEKKRHYEGDKRLAADIETNLVAAKLWWDRKVKEYQGGQTEGAGQEPGADSPGLEGKALVNGEPDSVLEGVPLLMKLRPKVHVGPDNKARLYINGKEWVKKTDVEALEQKIDEADQTRVAAMRTVTANRELLKEQALEWKAKYEKCITTIRKFDPGIISMYDL